MELTLLQIAQEATEAAGIIEAVQDVNPYGLAVYSFLVFILVAHSWLMYKGQSKQNDFIISLVKDCTGAIQKSNVSEERLSNAVESLDKTINEKFISYLEKKIQK